MSTNRFYSEFERSGLTWGDQVEIWRLEGVPENEIKKAFEALGDSIYQRWNSRRKSLTIDYRIDYAGNVVVEIVIHKNRSVCHLCGLVESVPLGIKTGEVYKSFGGSEEYERWWVDSMLFGDFITHISYPNGREPEIDTPRMQVIKYDDYQIKTTEIYQHEEELKDCRYCVASNGGLFFVDTEPMLGSNEKVMWQFVTKRIKNGVYHVSRPRIKQN